MNNFDVSVVKLVRLRDLDSISLFRDTALRQLGRRLSKDVEIVLLETHEDLICMIGAHPSLGNWGHGR